MIIASALIKGGVAVAEEVRGYKGYETPAHVVEERIGALEIRSIRPHLVAEVTVSGSRDAAAGTGFRVLAGYIFGGNADGARIAMTTPVTQEPQDGGDLWQIRFALPEEWRRERLPAPDDTRIRLVDVAAERRVVLVFSGRPEATRLEEARAALEQAAAEAGLRVTGPPLFAFYDSPMTLPARRRNEVSYALR
ncbi:MAG: heme-binding protein [Rhodobacteraceae bacterium]|nr:heme-binding protein [Paracoccaceae bacterium]